ncbi:MAG: ribonuclease R [Candidatus Pacebacteria bacterium]|nr:ribonuclease R [Candidatus Paceibacterota bacterium]
MSQKIKGVISITTSGCGYLKTEGQEEEDIKINASLLNTALHNDEVEVVLLPKKEKERQHGEVISVLKRAKERFVGRIDRKNGKSFGFLIPDDNRMYVDIFIPNIDKSINRKKKVLVEIEKWKDPKKNPEGKIVKVIGNKGVNDVELESIVLEKGLEIDFPSQVEKEAENIERKGFDLKNRRDFRNDPVFTIDPEDAKDFDDALSVKDIGDGLYEVGVHIADVSYYVKEGSKIDKEARKRAFSIYLVDRTIPMLPEVLSNNLCSLMPDKDRATFSAVFKMKENGEVVDSWFGEGVICSKRRFSYKEAQTILDNKKGEFHKELSILAKIAERLKKERMDAGALSIEEDELFFELDNDGRPISLYRKEHLFTHNLIEEFMVIANKTVAEKFNTLHRIHDNPDRKTISSLIAFLLGLGYRINIKGDEISSSEINKLFQDIKGKDEEFLVKNMVLRSMSKAKYSTLSKRHFGLALNKYMHFTSPIRRYADLVMHRIVKKKLRNEKVKPENYEEVAREISLRELDVLDAERSSIRYKQVQYMANKVGEEFQVIVSGVTSFGIFVQEIETKVEGMISIRDMDDDYYILDEESYSLIGTRKRKRYALGNKIKVKLVEADQENRRLNFAII